VPKQILEQLRRESTRFNASRGYENLSASVPIEIGDIERTMRDAASRR